jgi:hypothetical protein
LPVFSACRRSLFLACGTRTHAQLIDPGVDIVTISKRATPALT